MAMKRLLCVSRGHLSKSTQQWLDQQLKVEVDSEDPTHRYLASSALCSVVAFPYDFGWFILVVICAPSMESVEAVPTDLFNLIEFAGDLGVEWLQIDRDGECYDELPFFE